MKKKGLLLILLSSMLLSACGGGDPATSSSEESVSSESSLSSREPIPVSSVELTLEKTEVTVGDEIGFSVSVFPENADEKEVSLRASEEGFVEIKQSTILALKAGTVDIIATSADGLKSSVKTLVIQERRTFVNDQQFLNDLPSDAFATGTYPEGDGWGFSDAGKVGIDKQRFETETLYPVPEGATEYAAKDYGIAPGAENNVGKLINLLSSLQGVEGTKVVRFEGLTYEFGNSITASSLKDVYLVGEENTKFVFTGWMSFIVLTECENFHINGITFDIDPSPTITGVIDHVEEDASNGYVYVKVDEGYDLTDETYSRYALKKTGSYAEYYFDEEYQAYVPDRSGNLYYNPGLKNLEYSSETKLLKCTLSKSFAYCSYKTPPVGKVVGIAFQVYENHGFYFKNCVNTHMEDVTTYTVGGMGMRTDNGKNLYLNRVRFIREPGTKRLLTCTADILHTCNLSGEAIFTNCELEGSHDDAINVKSFYTKITAIRNNVVSVAQTQNEVTIGFDVGDEVDVYDPTGLKYKDTYVVQKVEQIGTSFDLTLDKVVPSRGSVSYLGFSLGNATKAIHLTLDNTWIKNKRNRGILLQGRDSVIKNCTFQNVNMGAVQILGVDDVFKEAIVPKNIRVENTKFLQCWDDLSVFTWDASGKSTPGTLQHVDIENNYFYRGVGSSVYLKGVGDVSVKNNFFQERYAKAYSVRADYVEDIRLEDNAYYLEGQGGYNFASISSNATGVTQSGNAQKGTL